MAGVGTTDGIRDEIPDGTMRGATSGTAGRWGAPSTVMGGRASGGPAFGLLFRPLLGTIPRDAGPVGHPGGRMTRRT